MKVDMSVRKTKNVISLGHNTLREVDDFNISLEAPKQGKMTLVITLGELEPVECNLSAESDDLQKIKEWMEAIARDEQHSSVVLGAGAVIACELTEIPESSVEKTYRYLDEESASSIAVLSVTAENGVTYSAVLKIKHFINALYVALMLVSVRDQEKLTNQWYAYTEEYKKQEGYKYWIEKSPYWHQSQLTSSLIEWYLQSSESYATEKPQFQFERGIAYIVTMWADYGCIFWRDGISIGDITYLGINDLTFDFSDIDGLQDWYDDFYRLADDYREIDEGTEKEKEVLGEIKEWHIRGFKLAQKIRERLPINIILHYVQSWDVGFGQLYFERDKGRIIFDPRKIERPRQKRG